MRCSCFQGLAAGLALVAAVQLLYLGLLSGPHGQDPRAHPAGFSPGGHQPHHGRPSPWRAPLERLRRRLAGGGTLDASGQYRIYLDAWQGTWKKEEEGEEEEEEGHDVVLATHTSLGNLHHAQQLAERWKGPVSLALFAPGAADARLAVGILSALAALCPPVRQLFRLHLVCQGDALPELGETHPHFARLRSCGDLFARLARLGAGRRNYAPGVANASYPNNLLRNVARRAAGRRWVLVVDMDMVPSEGLREAFLALPRGREEATPGVYVVPAFEIRHTRRIPGTKAELLQLYQVGEIRPFYEELCWRCQAPTNYSHWLNLPVHGPLRVAYQVEWRDPWEPFYIGPSSVPPYDERFKQYGFNRISQACELHVAGYRFSVLSNAFLVHKGFKVAGEFHSQKDAENQHNKMHFRQFKQDLKAKYPTSPRRC